MVAAGQQDGRAGDGGFEPFRIQVVDAQLDDLHRRLDRWRRPAPLVGAGPDAGLEPEVLEALVDHWRHGYDWREHEARINAHEQLLAEIDGQRIHLLHVRSAEPAALPLVLTHGWPGSIVEFLGMIGPLTDPVAHGGDAGDAFHVVCPSLPGYGFSGPTTERGWDTRRTGQAWAQLMARLGYERYGAQGGDWGSMVSTQLGAADPEHCVGVHLNMLVAGPPGQPDDLDGLTEAELAGLAAMAHYGAELSGYMAIQSTKPQTLATALTDSPVGQLAWIAEKFRDWTDCEGPDGVRDLERAVARDDVLTDVMLYWLTGTAGSSARMYFETLRTGAFSPSRLQVPVGVALFPHELFRPPRRWAEAAQPVVHWTEMPAGGHFAALEQPALLVDDVRTFFRPLR
jgi:epoxide hydrolase